MCPSFSSSPALPFVPAVTSSGEMSLEEAIGYVASDELIKFKESVKQFAQDNIAPHATKIDQPNSFPNDVNLWKLIRDFDLHGIRTSDQMDVTVMLLFYICALLCSCFSYRRM
ncbi:isovaleryl-CoA dehydrogenase, mitochondrial-like isoform X2 [Cucumis sativus]|uniref:isovaleryl-CoA dehydrogenase, mitochondrial-like isoform X2 n=1 Tax=Cucumis sativus TaxID=3659 RepID=UPI0012F50842|nr:isovaleryl-CoA dehydrogenase, mitochondrial-like isoform X2 [Cucumis sativus]